VPTPCTWQEVERGDVGPGTFTLRGMADRIGKVGDLWADMPGHRRALTAPMAALEKLLTESDWKDAFAASTRRPTSRKRTSKA
jgi:DNA primase